MMAGTEKQKNQNRLVAFPIYSGVEYSLTKKMNFISFSFKLITLYTIFLLGEGGLINLWNLVKMSNNSVNKVLNSCD